MVSWLLLAWPGNIDPLGCWLVFLVGMPPLFYRDRYQYADQKHQVRGFATVLLLADCGNLILIASPSPAPWTEITYLPTVFGLIRQVPTTLSTALVLALVAENVLSCNGVLADGLVFKAVADEYICPRVNGLGVWQDDFGTDTLSSALNATGAQSLQVAAAGNDVQSMAGMWCRCGLRHIKIESVPEAK